MPKDRHRPDEANARASGRQRGGSIPAPPRFSLADEQRLFFFVLRPAYQLAPESQGFLFALRVLRSFRDATLESFDRLGDEREDGGRRMLARHPAVGA